MMYSFPTRILKGPNSAKHIPVTFHLFFSQRPQRKMAVFFLHLATFAVLFLANDAAAETCPHAAEVDAFNFKLHMGLVLPHDPTVEVSCTPKEMDFISSTLASAMSDISLHDNLHIVDLAAGSICPEHRRSLTGEANLLTAQFLFTGGAVCRLCIDDSIDRRSLRGRVSSVMMVDAPAEKHRRNAETGDLCGCQTLSFPEAITTEMDSTDEWLHSHGIDIRDTADSIELDFVSPAMLGEVGLSEVYNLDVTLVDGSTANFDANTSISGVTSVTLSEGSMSSIEYCFDACEAAAGLFVSEIPDVEASISESLTAGLDGATVGCLEGLGAIVTVELVPVPIGDVSNECND